MSSTCSDSDSSSSLPLHMECEVFSEDEDSFWDHDQPQIQPYMYEPLTENSDSDCQEPEHTPGTTDQARLNNTDWCQCGSCQAVESIEECSCCRESARIVKKMKEAVSEGLPPVRCVTQHPGFQDVCCNISVIQTAYYQYRQEYGECDLADEAVNRIYQYIAYRQLALWCWRYLGRRVRVSLPACAVTSIRAAFPSEELAGFKYPSLQ